MKLYNTLTGGTETFLPSSDIVKMYVCGVTPYAPSHLGHAMMAVVFDVLRRYIEFMGFAIRHVENFTDVDDKMIQAAKGMGISTEELAESNIQDHIEHGKTEHRDKRGITHGRGSRGTNKHPIQLECHKR